MQSTGVQSAINANIADRRDGTRLLSGLSKLVWKKRCWKYRCIFTHCNHSKRKAHFLGFSQFARVRVVQTVK